MLNALLTIETAELTAIVAETDACKAASAIAAFQLEFEERMLAEGDSDAAKNAELMSQRIQMRGLSCGARRRTLTKNPHHCRLPNLS